MIVDWLRIVGLCAIVGVVCFIGFWVVDVGFTVVILICLVLRRYWF